MMMQGRALLFSGMLMIGSPYVWPKDNLSEEEPHPHPSVPPTYRVWIWQENGDTLWRIAEKVYGDRNKWPLIYEANRDVIKDPNKIYPKQVLKIPPIDWHP